MANETVNTSTDNNHQKQNLMVPVPDDVDPRNFARSYQIDALEKAVKQNTIVYLETGSGKTLIAIMLIRSYAHLIRKPSPFVAVFLVPTVHLVTQQAEVVKMHTDLKVGKYWGELGVDFWDAGTWKHQIETHEVLVMTPRILLDALRHGFYKLDIMKLLIFDECHNARGNSDYACILKADLKYLESKEPSDPKEFYHPQSHSSPSNLPRILGMTACLVKSKGSISANAYARQILEFENLMNSKEFTEELGIYAVAFDRPGYGESDPNPHRTVKSIPFVVYTVVNESELTEFIPFSTLKLKLYDHVELPPLLSINIENQLLNLKMKYTESLNEEQLTDAPKDSAVRNISRLCENILFCARDLGVWIAYQAAKLLSSTPTVIYYWGGKDGSINERIVQSFSEAVSGVLSPYIPSGLNWCIGNDLRVIVDAGLLSARVNCLIESLMDYREKKELRCIVFVERVITAITLKSLLSEVFASNNWTVDYMAGNHSGLTSQKINEHLKIIDSFRKGAVNIIVATQILEEGLDVQRCNLVIRFDPSQTVCSFIQSKGRARMEGSDYLLIIRRGDTSEFFRVKNYLSSGDTMREESLRYSSLPCAPHNSEMYGEEFYRVETTGALVSLSSSVALIYHYCSQLPSDGYFKPAPRFIIDDADKMCTLHLPNNCPLQTLCVKGPKAILKKLVCLKACEELHRIGALTDNLLPVSFDEEANTYEPGELDLKEEQVEYFPGELISSWQPHLEEQYYCYRISMKQKFDYETQFKDIILVVKCDLGDDFTHTDFELVVPRGSVIVDIVYTGTIHLTTKQVFIGTKFQVTVLRLLIDRGYCKLAAAIKSLQRKDTLPGVTYLILPSIDGNEKPPLIDWDCLESFGSSENMLNRHMKNCSGKSCARYIHTKDKVVCSCMLVNSLVVTPHNGYVYCITGFFDGLDGNSVMKTNGECLTYREYYQSKYGIKLQYGGESLLRARQIFTVQNYLRGRKCNNEKESTNAWVELPPGLCSIILSYVSLGTVYSFSMVPSIMHRVQSILLALNLKRFQIDHCTSSVRIPTIKVLEAITTKKCQEGFSLESLETLGDSFLKYAVSQQLFRKNKYHHEGLLSIRKEIMVSNNALYKLGCERKLQGFIRHECFDPKNWVIPGDYSVHELEEVPLTTSLKIYRVGSRSMKSKVVADVVEGLIGAYLITGGELAALVFMDWLGIEVDFVKEVPSDGQFISQPERHVNVNKLESLLKYSFRDPSLLVEALTHGSYQLIPRCYQRLEFLGDSVLDYLITYYMYTKYPGMSPGQLTDLRSSAVNNDCYALAAVKAGLHEHVLHVSPLLHGQIKNFVESFGYLSLQSTCGWESEIPVPKVLGDVIESLAGAIFVDSGYSNETVWNSIRPILEPLATPDTMKLHPVKELEDLCRSESYEIKISASVLDGKASITVEVRANGNTYTDTRTGMSKKDAKKLAAKNVLEQLKAGKANNP